MCCPPGQICSQVLDPFTGFAYQACRLPCGDTTCRSSDICCDGICKETGTIRPPEFRALYQHPVFGGFSWEECTFTGEPPDNYYGNCMLWCGGQAWDVTYGECQQPGRNCVCCHNTNVDFFTTVGINYTSPCDCVMVT
jgi:hypothetical protein